MLNNSLTSSIAQAQPEGLPAPPSAQSNQLTIPTASQPSMQAPLPPPEPTKQQLQNAVKARQIAIASMTKTLSNPALLADPDKLQKSLLSNAADIYRVVKDQGTPEDLIGHALDIMKDPRGPKAALQDRLTMALSSLSDLDMHSRIKHGTKALQPSQAPTPGPQV